MAKPSVLFINRVYPPSRGASARVLRDLAHHFKNEGWDVSILTTDPKGTVESDNGIHVVRIGALANPRGVLGYVWVWLKLWVAAMFMKKRSLVVTMTDPPMLVVVGRFYAWIKRAKHIHWCQDLYPDLLPSIGVELPDPMVSFFKKLSRRSMKNCSKVITVGRCMARQLTHTGLEPSKVTVIPNWPDYEIIDPSYADEQDNIKRDVQVNGAKPESDLVKDEGPRFRILYAGNIGRAHPMKTIFEAAEKLLEYPEIEFLFVGDSPNHQKLATERDKRNLTNIKFLPYQPIERLRAIMESGDVHLVSIKNEAAGMLVPCKFYGAMAVGRPCIYVGPDDTEIAKVIKDFKAGSIVAQGDGKALADTILQYRLDGDVWFKAHEGASKAGDTFIPYESVNAWFERAQDVLTQ